MTGHRMPVADRWALDTGAAIAVSHGSVSLVANATLTPELARDLARRAHAERLRDIGVDESRLEDCVEAAAQRPQLKLTPPPADADEIRALYRAAW